MAVCAWCGGEMFEAFLPTPLTLGRQIYEQVPFGTSRPELKSESLPTATSRAAGVHHPLLLTGDRNPQRPRDYGEVHRHSRQWHSHRDSWRCRSRAAGTALGCFGLDRRGPCETGDGGDLRNGEDAVAGSTVSPAMRLHVLITTGEPLRFGLPDSALPPRLQRRRPRALEGGMRATG